MNLSDSRNSPSPINATNSPSVSEELGVTVPSQDEADAAAAAEISAQNADAEFDALQKEVESGG